MIKFIKSLYLPNRFFIVLLACIIGFLLCFIFDTFFVTMRILFGVAVLLFLIDMATVFIPRNAVECKRICPDKLSNGDENKISIYLRNLYSIPISVSIVEEAPFQFQMRNLNFHTYIGSNAEKIISYELRPTKRGEYAFGTVNVYVSSFLGLVKRRYKFNEDKTVAVYPSFLEMNRYELLAASNRLTDIGIKKIRRIGHATEFDHIKHYVMGDDPRTINYKASARVNQLMVNTYQEEKSQQVYCLIDKGRTMEMPFDGMTLLDYAINSSLMVSSAALSKNDKVGLITFSKQIDQILPADRNRRQRNKILETLYSQRTDFKESDYERLFVTVRHKLNQRSLIILFTNFETVNGMRRQLKYLSRLAKDHLVLVTFFLNSEFDDVLSLHPDNIQDVFRKAMAEKLSSDKQLIVKELNRNGIYTVLSSPKNLTIDSINKYLEFKTRGLI
ncbi:MAG: DUF58 domain-containing protein [Dysgonomonas sp.]